MFSGGQTLVLNPRLFIIFRMLLVTLIIVGTMFATRDLILWLVEFYPNKLVVAIVSGLWFCAGIWFLRDQIAKFVQESREKK